MDVPLVAVEVPWVGDQRLKTWAKVVDNVTAAAGDLQQFAAGLNTSLSDVNKLIEAGLNR